MNRPCAVTLRPARAPEAQALARMSRDLIEIGLAWRYQPSRMEALIKDPETVALVACERSRIQGFAVMHFGELHAHLVLLCVRPTQQRCGIGRRLHEWLLQSARVAGLDSITGIGEALVKARIIRNLTHKALAERMDLAEQQIQRYEATRYAGVSIERLQAVADALKLRVNEVFTLETE